MGGARKVFCSHRSVDKPAVADFARRLRQAGIDAWLDQWEIQPGEDFVARINQGLAACDAGLVFFSSREWPGRWFEAEVSTLTLFNVEHGTRLIPVLIDEAAPLPPLLRRLARRGIEDFQQIVDAIEGWRSKPPLGPAADRPPRTRVTLRLERDGEGRIRVAALEGGAVRAELRGVALPAALDRGYADFLQGRLKEAARDPATAAPASSLGRDLAQLGDQLGGVLFAGAVGDFLRPLLARVSTARALDLRFEAADAGLLALPFEAARLDGDEPALRAGVTVARVVHGAPTERQPPLAWPLKLLVAVGAPDEGRSPHAVLDLEHELQGLLDAVEPRARQGNAEVRFLEVGHPGEIARALQREAYHVLHLSGHGSAGRIELEDEDGAPVSVSARELADALRQAGRNVPLVFLSSCHGGAVDDATGALAAELVREGVPQVLAMQTRVTDRYAAALAREFYAVLADVEQPQPAQALAVARQKLERERRQAVAAGAAAAEAQPEYATATLFRAAGDDEPPLVDYGAARLALAAPPVHAMAGPVPQLRVGELIGRRAELRRVLRVLRDHPASVQAIGRKAGVVVTGIGGGGKSSLAGRAMARLREDGWVVAALSGRFGLADIGIALGLALQEHPAPGSAEWAARFKSAGQDERQHLGLVTALLRTQRVLLVLDNFEDHLETGGGAFREPTLRDLLEALARGADTGRLLLTSRYPLPGFDAVLDHQALPPLSPANVRKLLWRLPGLQARPDAELREVQRCIGGHPRMLEFLDGLLRHGAARLPEVTQRLRDQAQAAGIDLREGVDNLAEALRATWQLGARDVLLDELRALARAAGDEEALLQCAVFSLPVSAGELAWALHGGPPDTPAVKAAWRGLERLCGLSLVTALEEDRYWVHRWTAEALAEGGEAEAQRRRRERAARCRVEREGQGVAADEAHEAALNFIDAGLFDEGSELAAQLAEYLVASGQTVAAATFCGEILPRLPKEASAWSALADVEATCDRAMGQTQRALDRYREMLQVHEGWLASAPECAELQHALSVTYIKLGDLLCDLGQGEQARRHYEQALDIAQRLAQAEPARADFQRDLSVSFERLGDLLLNLGKGEQARRYYEQALKLRQHLAQAAPGHADLQRDLSVAYNKLGDLLRGLGQGKQARHYYEQSLNIRQHLAQAEPGRANLQRDLSVSFSKLGDLLHDLGQAKQARRYYEQTLDIVQRLAQAEPGRADFQRDLSVSFNKLGDLLRDLGQSEQACRYYEQDLDIAQRLSQAEPGRADLQRELCVSLERIALVDTRQARSLLTRSAAVREQLAQAEPGRADLQVDWACTLLQLAHVQENDGLSSARQGFEILRALDEAGRLTPVQQRTLEAARQDVQRLERDASPSGRWSLRSWWQGLKGLWRRA